MTPANSSFKHNHQKSGKETPLRNTELVARWQTCHDQRALDLLIRRHLRLLSRMAARYRHFGMDQSDLLQAAQLGIVRAADLFDSDRGASFTSFAFYWIRAHLRRAITDQGQRWPMRIPERSLD